MEIGAARESQVSSSPPQGVRVLVFADSPGSRGRAGRTVRALRRRGIAAEDACDPDSSRLAEILAAGDGPVWLVRAGAWPARFPAGLREGPEASRSPALLRDAPIAFPRPSATGLPLCALGAVVPEAADPATANDDTRRWAALLAETGGDFHAARDVAGQLPIPGSLYLERPVAESLARRLARAEDLPSALRAEIAGRGWRVIRYPALDVHFDPALRVAQMVTSLQRGGAEQIAISLRQTLCERGIRSLLVTLGSPTRGAYPTPPGTVDVSGAGSSRQDRARAAAEAAACFAADLVHGHLLHAEDTVPLAALGLPLLLTIHNMPSGWPKGTESLRPRDAALLVACSKAVECELRAAGIPLPVRTIWNGIEFAPPGPASNLGEAARAFRRQWGIGDEDFVLLSLANPRPQKRLERLPPILAALQAEFAARGIARAARLVVAGEASRADPAASAAEEAFRQAVSQCGVRDRVHVVGASGDVATVLAAADVLVSASAYEGMSLAHLEALAAGRPVVATAAGGTAEVGRDNPAMSLLPLDAPPREFARILAGLALAPPAGGRAAAEVHFTRFRMAEGYARLYPRAIEAARPPRPRQGLWLVTNNFSSGGAQSSARRLLLGLAAAGVRVRAAVLEEQADYPTPGRRALTAAGVPVLTLPPAGTIDPAEAVALLLERIDGDPPQAVLLWNAIAQYKVLLADALLDTPLYDVSPGEMYFASLEKYFQRPRPGLPYRAPREYGARLSGVIVKYQAEAERAGQWLGVPVHVVPNGVPLDPLPGLRAPREPLVIGTAARISPQKKLEELLLALREAHARLPPYTMRIAGGVERGCAEYAEHLRQLAERLPVEWMGELDDPRPFYRDLDLFVMISEPAGCPNASLEAMAAGLPVVATDVGGAAEQVRDRVTGRLVARNDPAAFADALVELAGDGDLRDRYGAAGRDRIAALFDEQRMLDDYRRILFA